MLIVLLSSIKDNYYDIAPFRLGMVPRKVKNTWENNDRKRAPESFMNCLDALIATFSDLWLEMEEKEPFISLPEKKCEACKSRKKVEAFLPLCFDFFWLFLVKKNALKTAGLKKSGSDSDREDIFGWCQFSWGSKWRLDISPQGDVESFFFLQIELRQQIVGRFFWQPWNCRLQWFSMNYA